MTQPAHISAFNGPSMRQFVLDREIEVLGVRCLELAVDAPLNGEVLLGIEIGECNGGRSSGTYVDVGKCSVVDEARRSGVFAARSALSFDLINACGVGNRRAHAEGAVLIEDVDERLAVVIVEDAGAGTNGSSAIG